MTAGRSLLKWVKGDGRTWMACGAPREGRGVAVTAMRPVGVVKVGGKCYEATAAGGVWLGPGEEVVVKRRRDGGLEATKAAGNGGRK